MPVKMRYLQKVAEDLAISLQEMKRICRDFQLEMTAGLSGKGSSLKMIPSYADKPTGKEKGKFIALDLGGTNLRILELQLKGRGQISSSGERKFVLDKKYIAGSGKELFGFIALCVKDFCLQQGISDQDIRQIGFTFSFPVEQSKIDSGKLLHWTKDFNASGVIGHDVVKLLNSALLAQGLRNMRICALANDTVGTLVTRAYRDPSCSIGMILGTGTNACYQEKVVKIRKLAGRKFNSRQMIINVEWGNFDKLPMTAYDRILDKASLNPGQQILEKMVSGMYLGEIARLVLQGLIKDTNLFNGQTAFMFESPKEFKSEYMSQVEADLSYDLSGVEVFLKRIGIQNSSLIDRKTVQAVCRLVAIRGARIAAAVLSALIFRIDRDLACKHTIAVDGSLYELHSGFSRHLKAALKEIFGSRSNKLRMALTKDGSGIGAAVIAAVSAQESRV